MQTAISESKHKMEQALAHLRDELSRLRTGRASLALLDGIKVEVYGQQMPINQVASLNVPEARLITIQPWDGSVLQAIEKAIQKSGLGLTPANDGKVIRLPIPPLNEERRKELVKLVKKYGEEAKVAVRNVRRDANEATKVLKDKTGGSEDELKRAQQDVQKLTDGLIAQIDDAVAAKEKDVMTV